MRRLHHLLPVIAAAALAGACGDSPPGDSTPGTIPRQPSPTPTAFQPSVETPAGELSVWVSPELPAELAQAAQTIPSLAGRSILPASDIASADVVLGANPDVPVSTWVFALAAPFPTIPDGVSLPELRSWWQGGPGPAGRLYIAPENRGALESALGPASDRTVFEAPAGALVERAWDEGSAWAIVPFETLIPRWKVMEIDGESPLQQDFDPGRYALAIALGLSGPQAIPVSAAELGWPASNRDPSRLTSVLMTGVTALTRGVAWRIDAEGVDFPSDPIRNWLDQADLMHVSQEIAFAEDCPPPDPYQANLRFCGDPDHLGVLESAGVDLVELSGNHILDWGRAAFLNTLEMYRSAGMMYFAGGVDLDEARRPALAEHNGNRIAFLGCNMAGPGSALARTDAPGGMPCDFEFLEAEVGRLRRQGYAVIFTFQWYEAYRSRPLPAQEEAFRRMIDAGAGVVQGSQAHQPMGFEFHEDGLIHYGLGNLFFDQMWSIPTRQEMLDRHVFYDGRHISTEVLTAFLEDFAQPRPMTDAEREEFLRGIYEASGW